LRDNIMEVDYFLIQEEEEVERLIKSNIWRFEIQPESEIPVESRGATDKGIDNRARYLSTPEAR
jgi:hypothetical protein